MNYCKKLIILNECQVKTNRKAILALEEKNNQLNATVSFFNYELEKPLILGIIIDGVALSTIKLNSSKDTSNKFLLNAKLKMSGEVSAIIGEENSGKIKSIFFGSTKEKINADKKLLSKKVGENSNTFDIKNFSKLNDINKPIINNENSTRDVSNDIKQTPLAKWGEASIIKPIDIPMPKLEEVITDIEKQNKEIEEENNRRERLKALVNGSKSNNNENLFIYDEKETENQIDNELNKNFIDFNKQSTQINNIKPIAETAAALPFFNLVKEQIDEMFNTYRADETLTKLIKNSRFCTVMANEKTGYNFGIIYNDAGTPTHICYAIWAPEGFKLPQNLENSFQFLPKKFEEFSKQYIGFYLSYQNASTGEIETFN
jgi:hypothetical protein